MTSPDPSSGVALDATLDVSLEAASGVAAALLNASVPHGDEDSSSSAYWIAIAIIIVACLVLVVPAAAAVLWRQVIAARPVVGTPINAFTESIPLLRLPFPRREQ